MSHGDLGVVDRQGRLEAEGGASRASPKCVCVFVCFKADRLCTADVGRSHREHKEAGRK